WRVHRSSTGYLIHPFCNSTHATPPRLKVLRRPVECAQFTSDDWQSFLKAHHMVPSMSRRGNCHDNAVAESFFSALKKERIKRRIYPSRATATSDLFDYIEMFYNPVRRHGSAGDLSPIEFERRYALNGS
ncbi:IS3 family transposase, partial [Burkholderia cenocepacia]